MYKLSETIGSEALKYFRRTEFSSWEFVEYQEDMKRIFTKIWLLIFFMLFKFKIIKNYNLNST